MADLNTLYGSQKVELCILAQSPELISSVDPWSAENISKLVKENTEL